MMRSSSKKKFFGQDKRRAAAVSEGQRRSIHAISVFPVTEALLAISIISSASFSSAFLPKRLKLIFIKSNDDKKNLCQKEDDNVAEKIYNAALERGENPRRGPKQYPSVPVEAELADHFCKPVSPPCMADPEHDHGFVYDAQGRVDLLRSPFFDVNLAVDDTVDNYVDRILFTLVPSVEEHLPSGNWRIIGRPPTSSLPATSPTNNTVGISCLLVASLRNPSNFGFLLDITCRNQTLERRIYVEGKKEKEEKIATSWNFRKRKAIAGVLFSRFFLQ
ncbi:hypothetical protein M5K25_001383 [Dendrobium thyrsiflorum]|uniref:Uncharacterized protein n=1 Tax=Dendrobium thyrsiflorum TaxID=117978 RepID=A0ABD0VXG9_DENTH